MVKHAGGRHDHDQDEDHGRHDKNDNKNDKSDQRKKYETAARAMPIGTVVWYWSTPNAEPQAAIIAGRLENATHCNLLVISVLGEINGRQNVLQAKSGDEVTGEYFQEAGASPLEAPEPQTADTTQQQVA